MKIQAKHVLIAVSLLAFGCGKLKRNYKANDKGTSSNGMVGIQEITDDQYSLAKQICKAMDQKRSVFRTLHNGKDFNFKITQKNCANPEVSTDVTFTLDSSTMSAMTYKTGLYVGPSMTEVQTSVDGVLKHFCPDINAGKKAMNTADVNDIQKAQVRFLNMNGLAYYDVNYFLKGADGNYELQSQEGAYVNIKLSGASDYPGMETQRIMVNKCPDGTLQNVLRQTFKDPV